MKKYLFFLMTFCTLFIFTGCGSKAGDGSSSDSTGSEEQAAVNCYTTDGTYDDGGYTDKYFGENFKFSPGYMPSDMYPGTSVPACKKGEFLFANKCYGQIVFNGDTGELGFKENDPSTGQPKPQIFNVWQSKTKLGAFLTDQEYYTSFFDDYACNSSSNVGTSALCRAYSYNYKQIAESGNMYTPYVLRYTSQYILSQDYSLWSSTNDYRLYGPSSFRTYVNYGLCYTPLTAQEPGTAAPAVMIPYNLYQWFDNGSMVLGGITYTLPLKHEDFSANPPQTGTLTKATDCSDPFFYADAGDPQGICYAFTPVGDLANTVYLVFSSRLNGTSTLAQVTIDYVRYNYYE